MTASKQTYVRTALKRLVADGLATNSAGRGIRVAEWSECDIEETFQLRMLLERDPATEFGPDRLTYASSRIAPSP